MREMILTGKCGGIAPEAEEAQGGLARGEGFS
jgi:hypothetical protein